LETQFIFNELQYHLNRNFRYPSTDSRLIGPSLNRRRFISATAGLCGLAACGRKRATGFPGFALITVRGENAIASVDLRTFQPARKVHLSATPSSVVAGQHSAAVLTPSNGTVHFLNPEQLVKVSSLRLTAQADAIRYAPDDSRLVGLSTASRELIVADLRHRTIQTRVRLKGHPTDFDLSPDPGSGSLRAAISGGKNGIVELVVLNTGQRRSTDLGAELGSIRFRSDGQLILIANYTTRSLVVLDAATLQMMCELPLAMRPENLCFSADFGQLFISGDGMDGVAIVFTYDTLEVEQTILAGRAPGPMVCSSNPRYLFVASRAGSEVGILSVDSRKVIAVVQGGEGARRLLVTPDQQYALILNERSGDLAVIRIPSVRSNRLKNGASLFAMVPAGEKPAEMALFSQLS
jgi:hypothetical protein